MSRTARLPLLLVLLAAALALPASASADSGAITNVQRLGDGSTAQATFRATSDFCGANGYCGFFAYARAVPASQPCAVGTGRAIWVSDDVATAAGTLGGTESFPIDDPAAPLRLCLFLFQAGDREYAVAQTVLDPATGTAPPSTVPPGAPAGSSGSSASAGAGAARTLSLKSARSAAAKALQKKYGRAYRSGKARKSTCRRLGATRVRCSVSWRYKRLRYRGTVTVTASATGKLTSKLAVRRSRLR